MSCRKHGYPWPSLATSPYRSSPPAGLQDCIPYPHIVAVCMYVRAGRPAFARPYVGVHRSTSLMSSSLLLQQCANYLYYIEIFDKWNYYYLMGKLKTTKLFVKKSALMMRLKIKLPSNYSLTNQVCNRIWLWITHKSLYAVKHQPTKSSYFNETGIFLLIKKKNYQLFSGHDPFESLPHSLIFLL